MVFTTYVRYKYALVRIRSTQTCFNMYNEKLGYNQWSTKQQRTLLYVRLGHLHYIINSITSISIKQLYPGCSFLGECIPTFLKTMSLIYQSTTPFNLLFFFFTQTLQIVRRQTLDPWPTAASAASHPESSAEVAARSPLHLRVPAAAAGAQRIASLPS